VPEEFVASILCVSSAVEKNSSYYATSNIAHQSEEDLIKLTQRAVYRTWQKPATIIQPQPITMIISPSFESESSLFPDSQHTMDNTDELYQTAFSTGGWGVVSRTGSDTDSSFGDNGEGVLILDGEENSSVINLVPQDLSIPGTESMPTSTLPSIGTMTRSWLQFEDDEDYFAHRKKRRFFILFLSLTSVLLFGGFGFLIRDRNALKVSVSQHNKLINVLEAEIDRLEQKLEDVSTANAKTNPEWSEGTSENDDYVTIFDTCWLTAKVRAGDCTKRASEAPRNLLDLLFTALGGGSPEQHDHEEDSNGRSAVFGDTIATATSAIRSKVLHVRNSLQEQGQPAVPDLESSISQATEALAEVVSAASEVVASGLKDLSDDPLKYILATVKQSSESSKPEKVTRKGLEELSVRMSAIMDDPYSYFEYRTQRA